MDIAGEGGNDDALALRLREEVAECGTHAPFGHGEARTLRVGALREQRKNAPVAELAEPCKVDDAALNRGVVDLEVAGMDNDAGRCVYSEAAGIRYRVVHTDKLHRHAAELHGLPRLNHIKPALGEYAVLLQLALYKSEGERSSVHRHVDSFEQIRKASDMILMSVGKDNSPELLLVFDDIGEIGDHEVYAEHVIVRESKSAVHDEHIVAALIQVQILSDLVKSAEGDNFKRRGLSAACGSRRRRRRDSRFGAAVTALVGSQDLLTCAVTSFGGLALISAFVHGRCRGTFPAVLLRRGALALFAGAVFSRHKVLARRLVFFACRGLSDVVVFFHFASFRQPEPLWYRRSYDSAAGTVTDYVF